MMDFNALAYPDTFEIGGVSHKGRRDRAKSEVHIPYTTTPVVDIGDTVVQRSGPSIIQLKVIDVEFLEGGSLEVGTHHPHMLTMRIENLTSAQHRSPAPSAGIHIGTVSGHQVQVGHHNTQSVQISLIEMAQRIAQSDDPKAKGLFRELLENNTVASIVGAGASAVLAALGG